MSRKLVFVSLFTCLNSLLSLGTPSAWAKSHLQNKDVLSKVDVVKDVCRDLPPPGSCNGHTPIALVTYDPFAFRVITNQMRENQLVTKGVAGDSECYIIKSSLEKKGYCVEGLPVMHASSIRDAIKADKHIARRYDYVANVTHGVPGAWVTRSKCESEAKNHCLQTHKFDNGAQFQECVDHTMAAPNFPSCPCAKVYNDLNQLNREYKKMCAQPQAVEMPFLLEQVATEEFLKEEYRKCQKEEINLPFYAEEGAPGIFGKLLSDRRQTLPFVYSVSCNTAVDPKETIKFKMAFCGQAPDGTVFNLSRQPTTAGVVFDAQSYHQFSIDSIIRDCSEGRCNFQEAQQKFEQVRMSPIRPFVQIPTKGDFVCFQCRKGTAHSVPCRPEDFPEHTQIEAPKAAPGVPGPVAGAPAGP